MIEVQTEQGLRSEWHYDTVKDFDFAYTSYGFVSVTKDALQTWAQVIQEQLKSILSNCTFGQILDAEGRTVQNEECKDFRFGYTLPKINFKSWY